MQPLQSVFFKCFLHFFHIPIFGRLMRRVWQQPDILCSKRVHLHHDHFIYNPLFTNLPIILPNPLFINHPISLSNPLCTNKSINLSNPFIHQYFFLIHYPNIIVLAFFPIHYPIIILSLFPRYYPISSNHSFQYSLITQPFTAIKSIIHQLYSHSVPSNTLFTNCTTIQCLTVQLLTVPTAQQVILTFSCCTQFSERSKTTDEDIKSWHEFGRPK